MHEVRGKAVGMAGQVRLVVLTLHTNLKRAVEQGVDAVYVELVVGLASREPAWRRPCNELVFPGVVLDYQSSRLLEPVHSFPAFDHNVASGRPYARHEHVGCSAVLCLVKRGAEVLA